MNWRVRFYTLVIMAGIMVALALFLLLLTCGGGTLLQS